MGKRKKSGSAMPRKRFLDAKEYEFITPQALFGVTKAGERLPVSASRYPCPECLERRVNERGIAGYTYIGSSPSKCKTCNRFHQRFRREKYELAMRSLTEEERQVIIDHAREVTYKKMFPHYKQRYE